MAAGGSQDRLEQVGAGVLSVGAGALALQVGLAYTGGLGWPPAFVAGCLGVVAVVLGAWLRVPDGPRQRVLVATALVWLLGWLAVAPARTVAGPTSLYLGALAIGSVLCVAGVAQSVGSSGEAGTCVAGRLSRWRLWLVGGVFAVPSLVGLLGRGEVVTLLFVSASVVALVLVFVFRPT